MNSRLGLLAQPAFARFWAAETISLFGSQVSQLAIPTLAVLVLHAGAATVGLLGAAESISFPLLGLFVGTLVDRHRRLPVLVAANATRFVALGTIPAAAAAHALSLTLLFGVALVVGVATVFFEIAYQSFLPLLLARDELIEGNAKLQLSASAAQVAGQPLAGAVIQLVGAATALLADALSFLISALVLASLGARERDAVQRRPRRFLAELAEGLRAVRAIPGLLPIVACTATANLGSSIVSPAFVLFLYRTLGLSPAAVGTLAGLSGAGLVVGSLVARPVERAAGLRGTLVGCTILAGLAYTLLPGALLGVPLAVVALCGFTRSASAVIYNIGQVSFRQALTPDELQGRVNGIVRTIAWGVLPLGNVAGGLIAARFGVVTALLSGGLVATLAVGWLRLARLPERR